MSLQNSFINLPFFTTYLLGARARLLNLQNITFSALNGTSKPPSFRCNFNRLVGSLILTSILKNKRSSYTSSISIIRNPPASKHVKISSSFEMIFSYSLFSHKIIRTYLNILGGTFSSYIEEVSEIKTSSF